MTHSTLQIDGYNILEIIHEGLKSLVFRGQRLSDNKPVILKLLRSEYPSFNELLQFRHQYTVTQHLEISGVVQPLALEKYRNSLVLVMPDEGFISLDGYLQNHSLSVKQCLKVGIKLAEILQGLYHHRIIHKDIKPANILIHPQTGEIQLIDFSIASLLPKETQVIQNPNILEGTLAYISPEQTGRMNRGIDYRTDFYSLGVTLYELITGKLPFEATDAMELVHCHIAKIPTFPQTPHSTPHTLVEIVMKLMAKNAEDRYQSAWGLQKDLETCLKQLEKTGTIELFEIGKQDICDHFTIPEKLYGRQQQVQQLLDAFNRISNPIPPQSPLKKGGGSEMMLVAGYSGVGKTAVVNEVHKPIVRQRGYFIKGKFDQFNRNIPFSAFVQALRDLMGQLLSENDAQLQQWKQKILEAVGDQGQVIIEVIPELENIIGQQPSVTELSGTAAQNRFNLLFQKFIQVFTTKEHPLVIFLDDLQWADSASLNLLKLLMSETDSQYLFLIGAYRDNEVSPAHPLMLTLDEIQKNDVNINTITLSPLRQYDLNQLVADTLHCSLQQALPLTQAVYQKTKGNPFFATQFLKALHEDKLIHFNPEEGFWQCDLAQVKLAAVSEDVVEFVSKRLQKLNPATQDALKLAACIGNEFNLETLAIVRQTSEVETATDLWVALKEGLILPTTEVYKFYTAETQDIQSTTDGHISARYKFLHDRIQQAAYGLIPEGENKETHLKIGQLLLNNIPEAEREERIFEIVNQFNYGIELISEQQEREALAQLNLVAGRKAKASTAYGSAITYFSNGIDLLPETAWESHYALGLALHEDITEASYLNTDFEQMGRWADVVLQQAKTLLDTIKVQQIRILATKAQADLLDALEIGLQVLKPLGVEFPEQFTEADIGQALQNTAQLWQGKSPLSLIDLPEMTDAYCLAAMEIMPLLIPCAYRAQPALLPLLICKQVEFSIQSGNCPVSSFAYGDYGLLMCGMLDQLETGYEFGQLALAIVEKFQATTCKSRADHVVNCLISHWKDPIRNLLEPLQEAYLSGLETGDLEFVAFNAQSYCYFSYFAGKELTHLAEEIESYRQVVRSLKQVTCLKYLDMLQQTVLNLLGRSKTPGQLREPVYNAEPLLAQEESQRDRYEVFLCYVYQTFLLYLFEQYEEAAEQSALLAFYLDSAISQLPLALSVFYDALIQLTQYQQATIVAQSQLLEHVQQQQDKLQRWAALAPSNYQHRWELVEAERCRVLDKQLEAMELYDQAIAGAKENGYIQEEALANELAAKFYLSLGRKKVAQAYMIEAYYCYSHWGAKAKVKDLEQRYPKLLASILEQQKISLNPLKTIASLGKTTSNTQATISSNTTGISDALDFTSVMKASQALSSEIELNQLIAQLMQIMMENAGANKGVLMLSQGSQLIVEAISTHRFSDDSIISTTQTSIPVEESLEVPLSVINSVKRSLKTLNLDDISNQTQFGSDSYLMQQQPQSLLCLPLCNRGEFLGILYLENNLTIGAFTDERVEVLKLLCSQAAISLENAQLYQKSQDYAQQLEQSLKDLQEAQVQLVQSEKMSALGQMMAGIAHEINNPVGFIGGNITHAEEYLQDLIEHLNLYQNYCLEAHPEIAEHAAEIDLEYLLEDLPELISSMKTGVNRIKNISTSMRTFSRSDTDHKVEFNLHEGIDSTLLILKHRLKANEKRSDIQVVKNYGNLPQIMGYPGQLNQVFMNIIANAIDVFDEAKNIENPQITITTELIKDGKNVWIKIQDNGLGMSEEVQQKVFDHLFTTKPVGKGTGLGLSISRQIVEDKHGGILKCSSQVGEGTEFIIQIPT
jgi:predicted ATPase/signal transduction histidine kinase